MYQFDTLHLWTYPGCLQEKTPLTRRLTDPNHITQTPSGTLSNTALTLIQVLKLYRGLAVINFNYGLLTLACSYEDENDRQNLKWSEAVFLALRFLLFCVRLLGFFLFFYRLAVSSLFFQSLDIVSYECQSSSQFGTAASLLALRSLLRCRGFYCVYCVIDRGIWHCVATKHQRNDDLHQANLWKQTFHTSAQNSGMALNSFKASTNPSYSMFT